MGLLYEALQAYRMALRLKPKLAEVHLGLGKIYFSLRNFTLAAQEYAADPGV